ncbi:MAG: hypothetical protein ACKO85_07830 [Isosphaeraceae bacterium]
MNRPTFRRNGGLRLALALLVTGICGVNLEAAAIQSANVVANQSMRQAWLNQNMAKNQAYWAKMAARQGDINAASVGKGPVNLNQVWNTFHRRMRFASQLKPASATGYLPNTSFVNDLWSRRAINAARFAQYHGTIAQVMDWDTYFRTNHMTPAVKPVIKPAVNPSQQIVVPEPASILSGLAMAAFGFWAVRRNRTKKLA